MGKVKKIFKILFGNEVGVTQSEPMDDVGFGVPASGGTGDKDGRLEFDKDAIMEELKTPPVQIETDFVQGKLALKILEVKRIISSLEKKKMDASPYREALLQLKNRKLFTSKMDEHLSHYPMTTREKIEALSSKYRLVFRNLEGVTRDIPVKAVKEIEQFCKPLEKAKISFNKYHFFLVAPTDWWQKKRDPILLAKSPFGNYYYILYAWDKEVNIVSELFEDDDT